MTLFNWFNNAPSFTNLCNGQTICINENATFVVDAAAYDPNWDAITFSISGGADSARFTIHPQTGVLCFVTPPDFEGQNSAIGNDDIYDVTIRVSDGRGGFSDVCLFVNVQNVVEKDGVVNGTGGGDVMGLGYTDAQGDRITDGAESIQSGAGDDAVYAAGGNDSIDGGTGNDNLFGENGNDAIMGSDGNDSFLGGAGNDTIYGGNGDDQHWAGELGDDLLYGGNGNDTLSGDIGIDTLYGDAGNDAIEGHEGADLVYGGAGDDYVMGADLKLITNAADRTLAQEKLGFDDGARDTLFGGEGNDSVFGNGGDDLLYGEDGHDILIYGTGNDTVYGGNGDDVIDDISGATSANTGNNLVYAGDGHDLVWDGSGDDSVLGGAGKDSIYGDNAGNDLFDGGADDDALGGGLGDDTALGGDGNDQVYGHEGNDLLMGNGGDDVIDGGDGNDLLIVGEADTANGGAGDDYMVIDAGNTPINILADGGSDGVVGDTLNASTSNAAQVVTLNTNTNSGTVNGLDSDTGADVTFANIESIITGSGADVVTGGGEGSAIAINTGAGDDRVVQIYNPASGAHDSYNGGANTDTFVLAFTAETWATPAAQAEVAAYLAHLNAGNSAVPFTFASINTTVTNFETFEITVNGVAQSPANAAVTATGDAIAFTENGPAPLAIDLLLNDVVPDRAASVQVLDGSAYGTLSLTTSLLTTTQTASLLFVPDNAALQALPEGTVVTETLTYRVTDVDGSIGEASVTITLTGTNDLATITGASTGSTNEDALAAITGALSVTDADTGEAAFQTPASLTGTYGSFTFNPATGAWAYTPSASAAALQSLAVGQQVTDSLTVTSLDGTASQTITVAITGQNDAPTLTAGVLAAVEDGPSVTLDLATLGDDVDSDDDGSTLTYTITGAPSLGTASITGSTLTFNGGAGLDGLAAGETLATVVTITATDAHGAAVSNDVTVTITGTNDAPTLTAGVLAAEEDGPSVTLDLASLGDDVDSDDDGSTLSYSITGAPSVGSASIAGSTLTFNGGAGLDSLAAGETLATTITITATDAHGASVSNDVTVTITGTNDAPTLTAGVLAAVEDGPSVSLDLASLGDDVDSDDDGSTLTYTITGAPSLGTASIAGSTLTFNGGAGLDSLAAGETLTTTLTITAEDGNGGSVSNDVTVTITGTNDAPTLTAGVLAAEEDGPSVSLDLATLGDDVDSDDDGSTLTYTITGAPSVGTASIAGSTLTFNGGAGLDGLAAGEQLATTITITATDAHGASVSNDVTVTITGTNDAPTLTAGVLAAVEDAGVASLDLATLGDDIDSDDDGSTLTYTITAGPAIGTASITGTTISYDAGTAFDYLAEGEQVTQDIEITAMDSAGEMVTSTLTVTITGTNDAPVVIIPAADPTVTVSGNVMTVSGTISFTDPDLIDTHLASGTDPFGNGLVILENTSAQYGGIGEWAWTFDIDLTQTPAGTELPFEWLLTDDGGAVIANTVTFIVPGTVNTPPIVTGPIVFANALGDGLASFYVTDYYTDIDGDALLALPDPLQDYPGITFTGTDMFELNCDDPAYQFLIAGETQTFIYTYLVSDGTDSTPATLEWTISGSREGIIGSAGADVLTGDDFESELLNGGAGDDTMTGGAGEDIFAYLTAIDGFDLITDFEQGFDRIGVSVSAFGGNLVAGTTATVLNTADYTTADSGGTDGVFILQSDGIDAILYWDADGGLGDNATAVAQLTGISTLTQDDFFLFI